MLLIVDGGLVVDILEILVSFLLLCWLLLLANACIDIVACPDYLTWGVSFDDGPSVNSTF